MSDMPFECPSCRARTFTLAGKTRVRSIDELVGAVGQNCERKLRKRDIED